MSCFVQYAPYELRESDWDTESEGLRRHGPGDPRVVLPGLRRPRAAARDPHAARHRADRRPVRGQHLRGRVPRAADVVHAPRDRLGQLPDADRRLLPVRLGHPPGRLRHGRAGQAGGDAGAEGPREGGRRRQGSAAATGPAPRRRPGSRRPGAERPSSDASVDLVADARPGGPPRERAAVRRRRPPAGRDRVRAGRRPAPGRARAELRRPRSRPGLAGGELPVEVGGKGWSVFEQVLVHEQYGQATGGLWSFIPGAYEVLAHADRRAAQALPRAVASGASGSGRTPSPSRTPAPTRGRSRRRPCATAPDWVINGEKWFVDRARQHRLHDRPGDGRRGRRRACRRCSSSTTTLPGVRMQYDPNYMHTFADRHPQFVLEDVRVPDAARLGGVGAADDLANEWFVDRADPHRRALHRGDGAAAHARGRVGDGAVQFGSRIYRLPGRVASRSPNSAADASAARLLTREAAVVADAGADPRSSTPRRRSPSCSPPRRRSSAPTA